MRRFSVVCCINQPEVALSCLLVSPCLAAQAGHQLVLVSGTSSAGAGMAAGLALARHEWLVLVHQDVYLPAGWDVRFGTALDAALVQHPNLAVAGVYGVTAAGVHAGHVLDRGRWLGAPVTGAVPVRSFDELLLAVRVGSGVCAAAELGWHLYGTDVCLAAEEKGWVAAVVDGPCEHRSALPRMNEAGDAGAHQHLRVAATAFGQSAQALLRRWPHAAPVYTPVWALQADFSPGQLLQLFEPQERVL